MQPKTICVRHSVPLVILALSLVAGSPAFTQPRYSTGASDTEIKIGNFAPYSGPASAYGIIGKINGLYFKMLNENGGIAGRRLNWISYDDAYSAPKAVEQARKLVENDEVLLLSQTVGASSNAAVMRYLNNKRVPQLLVSTGGTKFGDDPVRFPWTMPLNVPYNAEGRIYAKWILDNCPDAKIAVLSPNDEYGKDILKGVRDGLGSQSSLIVSDLTYDNADPTVDSLIVRAKASGANVFLNLSTPKFAAMAIRKIGELNWKPVQILNQVSQSTSAVLRPAGLDHSQGIISAVYVKDPTDATWQNDEGMLKFVRFMLKYAPDVDRSNGLVLYAYGAAQTLEYILRQAGDDLTRDNVMNIARNMKNVHIASLVPGITLNTSPNDYFPIKQMRMARFNGEQWELFGDLVNATMK